MTTQTKEASLLRGTTIVGVLTLISRVVGFGRDLMVARLLGAGMLADAFYVAFRIPNLLRSLVAEGAFTSAFVPVFANEIKSGHKQAEETLKSAFTWLVLITSLLTALGIIFAKEIVLLMAPGFEDRIFAGSESQADICAVLLQIMIGYIMFISAIVMLNGALNTVKIFGISAIAQITMNIVLIIGAAIAGIFEERMAAYVLAWSVIAGGFVQVATQIPTLKRTGFSLSFSRHLLTPPVRSIVKLMGPAVIGAAVYQVAQIIATILASLQAVGSVSWLFYADRIVQLPVGIFSIALASVLLPTLAIAHAGEDQDGFSRNLVNALRFTSFVILPTTAFLFFYSEPIAQLFFQRGQFDPNDTLQTSRAVKVMVLGIWAVSCHSLLVRAIIAKKDTRTPVIISAITLILTTITSVLLMGTPAIEDHTYLSLSIKAIQDTARNFVTLPELGFIGLAASTTIGAFISFALGLAFLPSRVGKIDLKLFVRATANSLMGCVAIAGGAHLCTLDGLAPVYQVLIGSLITTIIFCIIAKLLRMPELDETFSVIWRYLSRRRGKSN